MVVVVRWKLWSTKDENKTRLKISIESPKGLIHIILYIHTVSVVVHMTCMYSTSTYAYMKLHIHVNVHSMYDVCTCMHMSHVLYIITKGASFLSLYDCCIAVLRITIL